MNYFAEYDKKLKFKIKSVTYKKAKSYIDSWGYLSSTLLLPEYYQASGFNKIQLKQLTYAGKSKPKRTKSITLITPKGKMSWRRFSLMHPYAYWHITNELTKAGNWKKTISKLGRVSGINVYSTPRLDVKQKPQGMGIQAWKMLNDRDVLRDMSDFTYCATTDIKNFYPSIYTHSIAWAVEGKDKAWADKNTLKRLGNRLDKLFQNAREGQTNGIPIGSVLSDIIAELILVEIDKKLSKQLKAKKLNVIAARYRDDYKFLCKDHSTAEQALKVFSRILQSDFDFSMNDEKTHIDDDAVIGTIRPWEREFRNSYLLSKVFQPKVNDFRGTEIKDILVNIYELQSRYPYSRVSTQILSKLSKKIVKNKALKLKVTDAAVIIPLVRKLILLREDVTPIAMLFLDRILDFIPKHDRTALITEMFNQYLKNVDNEYQEIWLYRVCLHHAPELIAPLFGKSTNPLILMLTNPAEPHYKYFSTLDKLDPVDEKELEKFSLVDYTKLDKATKQPITPKSINIFPSYLSQDTQ